MSQSGDPASPRAARARTWGVCLALLGVAAAAPDGCLLRTMQKGGSWQALAPKPRPRRRAAWPGCELTVPLSPCAAAGLPNIVIFAWKFLFAAAIQFFFVIWGRGGPPTLRCLCSCWKWVTVAALCTVRAFAPPPTPRARSAPARVRARARARALARPAGR